MNMPSSFYEALAQGLSGDANGRRSLFLFAVEHSEAMSRPFGTSGQSRLAAVTQQLNEMVLEMARVDGGAQLDVGLVGYGTEGGSGVDSLWDDGAASDAGPVRDLGRLRAAPSRPLVQSRPLASHVNGFAKRAMDVVGETTRDWTSRNPGPLFPPVVLHVTAGDGEGRAPIAEAVRSRPAETGAYFFNCCLVDKCSNSVVVPDASAVPDGYCRDLHEASSDMPPLMEDVGALLRGKVTPRMREAAADLARRHGLPGALGSIGADLLGGALGRGGFSVPTGLFATREVNLAVEGLSIDSGRGFVMVRDRPGFKVFTRLCN